ncbi:MAG: hypothetical protein R3F60_26025 [bacterium]
MDDEQVGQGRLGLQGIAEVEREGGAHALGVGPRGQPEAAQRRRGGVGQEEQLLDERGLLQARGLAAPLDPALQRAALAEGAREGRALIQPVAQGPHALEHVPRRGLLDAALAVEAQGPDLRVGDGLGAGPVGQGRIDARLHIAADAHVHVGQGHATAVRGGHHLLERAPGPRVVARQRALLGHQVVHAGAAVGDHQHVVGVAPHEVGLVGLPRVRQRSQAPQALIHRPERPDGLDHRVGKSVERRGVGRLGLPNGQHRVHDGRAPRPRHHDEEALPGNLGAGAARQERGEAGSGEPLEHLAAMRSDRHQVPLSRTGTRWR